MMYPFLTLDDQTEIVHSQLLDDGSVKVYVEKPDEKDCFHYATCFLPEYRWEDVSGFSEAEIQKYQGHFLARLDSSAKPYGWGRTTRSVLAAGIK